MNSSHRRPLLQALAILLIVLATPLLWRVALRAWGPRAADELPSYLPVLEAARPREAFVADPVGDLRNMAPGYVIIGDSMAGRVDPDVLTRLATAPVAPVLENATGSAYWYLVLKNYVVASGIRPRLVIIFFRDTNLTDVTFRLDGPYRPTLDHVALDAEPELNDVIAARTRGPWHTVYQLADEAYGVNRARAWLEPALTAWPARIVAGGAPGTQDPAPGTQHPGPRTQNAPATQHAAPGAPEVIERINSAFTLDKLRPMAQADLESADTREADFASHVRASVLPLMLAAAREHDLHLCFVRVLRRPVNGQPPPESPELRRYAKELASYIRGNGAIFLDDRDDPELAKLEYADGDHIARDARGTYTTRFWLKIRNSIGPRVIAGAGPPP